MRLILASKSPRRREILENLKVRFEVVTSDADEHCSLTDPAEYVKEVSARKARAVKAALPKSGDDSDALIVACDTVVACEGKIMGKPSDRGEAIEMLCRLSGKKHTVLSGLALMAGDRIVSACEETAVLFDAIPKEELLAYVDSGDPFDKAGGYAIQGRASLWIRGIEGCYFNVVGLPIHLLNRLMKEEFGLGLEAFCAH